MFSNLQVRIPTFSLEFFVCVCQDNNVSLQTGQISNIAGVTNKSNDGCVPLGVTVSQHC